MKGKSEQGAILVLVASLLVVFFSFVAFAVDLSLAAASREETQHYARLAVLAALEAHISSKAETVPDKVSDALARAQKVSEKNLLLMNSSSGNQDGELSDNPSASGALLEPGVWLTAKDSDESCGSDDSAYPCFVPSDPNDADAKVTAYRITGSMYQGITTKLGRWLFGIQSFPVHVRAVSSIVPRHGCFLVDMSLSMIRETHPSRTTTKQNDDPTGGRGREATFLLESDNKSVSEDFYQTEHYNFLCSNELSKSSPPSAVCNGQPRPQNSVEWAAFLGFPFVDLTDQQYQTMHFYDDYRLKKSLGDGDYDRTRYPLHPDPASDPRYQVVIDANPNVGNDGRWYRADVYRDATQLGPEPLRTVFRGLNRAIETFEKRQVAGDKLCMIFYNSRMPWTGVIKPTDDFDYLKNLTNFDVTGPIQDDPPGITSEDLKDQNLRGYELLLRHNLIPAGSEAFSTDTISALSEAMQQLLEINPDGSASSFIVSIGDGVFNCRHCYDPDDFPNQLSGCTPGCNNTLQYYQQAKQDLYTFVNEALSERNVPIHWILVGGAVAPHTVERTLDESGVGDCLSDFDARKENVPYVKGGYNEDKFNSLGEAYNRMSTVDPWYEANTAVYEVAAATQGLFGPIRPPSDECTPKVQCDNSEERITEDPLCRTMVEQIDEYMNVVLGENPFILVQVSEG